MDGDGLARFVALGEVVPLEHARDGVVRRELHDLRRGELREPAGVEVDAGSLTVEDLEHLRLVGAGVRLDLFTGECRAGHVAAGGIADQRGEVPDEEGHLVAEVLEAAHLGEQHRVPEVQVGRRGIESRLHPQWHAPAELLPQISSREHLIGTALKLCDLFLEVHVIPVKRVLQ